jgi:hypothetical protein
MFMLYVFHVTLDVIRVYVGCDSCWMRFVFMLDIIYVYVRCDA